MSKNTSTKQLVSHLIAQGAEADQLDDLVHDLVSGKASDINNGGIEAQVEYIFDEHGSATEQAIAMICQTLGVDLP